MAQPAFLERLPALNHALPTDGERSSSAVRPLVRMACARPAQAICTHGACGSRALSLRTEVQRTVHAVGKRCSCAGNSIAWCMRIGSVALAIEILSHVACICLALGLRALFNARCMRFRCVVFAGSFHRWSIALGSANVLRSTDDRSALTRCTSSDN
jgi:hypothetical protein